MPKKVGMKEEASSPKVNAEEEIETESPEQVDTVADESRYSPNVSKVSVPMTGSNDKSILKAEKKAEKQARNSAEKEKKQAKFRESAVKILSHHRGSSIDPIIQKYRSGPLPEGLQQSYSVRKVVPMPESSKSKSQESPSMPVVEIPDVDDRDHHKAADFFNLISPYVSKNEGFMHLPREKKTESWFNIHRHRKTDGQSDVHHKRHHIQRCQECFQAKELCQCDSMPPKDPKSDWAILAQALPITEQPKKYIQPRFNWLEELEATEVDVGGIIERNFTRDNEICCFPFNTFALFSKRKIKDTQFWINNKWFLPFGVLSIEQLLPK